MQLDIPGASSVQAHVGVGKDVFHPVPERGGGQGEAVTVHGSRPRLRSAKVVACEARSCPDALLLPRSGSRCKPRVATRLDGLVNLV